MFRIVHNMLTETRNKHFSERLFYADSLSLLPQSVAPCRNGNIAAANISQLDSIYTFAYSYDLLNRLTSSVRMTDAGTSPSEQFSYDASGNIIFLTRYNGRQKIDSLICRYKNDGHQLVTVTDEGNDDDTYEVIEYHTEDMLADTSMWYDANGNLVYDEDRGISVIHYNVLNLPDTVQFINGNQIVNLYDAVGHKYRSITYIVPETAVTPRYEIMQYGFDIDTVEYMITEYAGAIENHYSRTDTTRRIHNATGYYTNNAYYHYIKDHLGNLCAVVHSTADTLIQGTIYYASGIPMAYSFGRDKQPYLYNGKEFVEAHGYNTYDYGFRGYYATIGRFTTIDPLAEQTPWQSPYAYANNNFINAIDWMGLSGGAFTTSDPNKIADLLDYLAGGGSANDYDTEGWDEVTEEWEWYIKGLQREYTFTVSVSGGGGGGTIANVDVVGTAEINQISINVAQYALEIYSTTMSAERVVEQNIFYWMGKEGDIYNVTQLFGQRSYIYRNSFTTAIRRYDASPIGKLGKGLGYLSLGVNAIDAYQNGIGLGTIMSTIVAALGIWGGPIGAMIALGYGMIDIGYLYYTGSSLTDTLNENTYKPW